VRKNRKKKKVDTTFSVKIVAILLYTIVTPKTGSLDMEGTIGFGGV
jgi:hypothetical protein